MTEKWFQTPFVKQCFATSGVALNMAGAASIMAFTTGLLAQLKRPGSSMMVDDVVGSWIAATPSICMLLGNFMVPVLMSRFGRKSANLASITISLIGWLAITFAKSVVIILVARFLHGINIGAILNLGPILIGEYSTPKYRGAFLMYAGVLSAIYVLIVHGVGSYFGWKITAILCLIINFVNLLIVINSPESPIWLADKQRLEESKQVFRWLRGYKEENELNLIIKASEIRHQTKNVVRPPKLLVAKLKLQLINVRKKEFYKPIIIMIHLYGLGQWAGINVLSTYPIDVIEQVIGKDSNVANHIIALDVHRVIINTVAVYFIRKVKRRTLLFSVSILAILTMLSTAAYTYAKSEKLLSFDHPAIGVILLHILMFTIASVTLPIPFIIAGEIFPLEYKGLAGGISIVFYAIHFSVIVKTLPYLFATIKIYGAYTLYAGIVTYCLVVASIFLPETKDRTLLDIEDELKCKPNIDVKTVESLLSVKG